MINAHKPFDGQSHKIVGTIPTTFSHNSPTRNMITYFNNKQKTSNAREEENPRNKQELLMKQGSTWTIVTQTLENAQNKHRNRVTL